MYVCSARSRRPQGSGGRGHWAVWLPLVFVGSMMFWTVALVLGGWSLMVVSDGAMEAAAAGPSPTVTVPMPGVEGVGGVGGVGLMPDRIPVLMEESQEPEDVNDNAGSAVPVLPAAAALPGD
jgi:hypothetical protein